MDIAEAKVERSFGWLNATQFLGALNDNIFKLLIIAFIIGIRGLESKSNVTALAGAVFVVPFLLFSAYAGKLADRFSKRNIIVVVKCAEVIVMTLGFVGFMLRIEWVLYAVLFLMAAQSAFFSPSKYGIIPELVDKERLSYANSLLVGLTYLAIVIGGGFVPLLLYVSGKSYGVVGLVCVGIAIVGLVVSLPIKKTPAAGSGRGASIIFLRDIWRTLWSIHRKRDLLLAVLASASFLLIRPKVKAGMMTVPSGLTASTYAWQTASAPPSTQPKRERELWAKTESPS